MRALVFDTEYVWAPGLSRSDEDGNDRAPHPPNAVIESIGFVVLGSPTAVGDEPTVRLGTIAGANECERVTKFVEAWSRTRPCLVSFNGRGADVPLILARLLRYGIVAPGFTGNVAFGNRYKAEYHVDLYDALGNHGAQRRGALDDWCRCIGWPGKGDVDGSDVARLLAGEHGRELVDNYCLSDAVQTAALYLRYCLVTGEISAAEYDAFAKMLLHVAAQDPRTRALIGRVDSRAYLLQPSAERNAA